MEIRIWTGTEHPAPDVQYSRLSFILGRALAEAEKEYPGLDWNGEVSE